MNKSKQIIVSLSAGDATVENILPEGHSTAGRIVSGRSVNSPQTQMNQACLD